MHGRPAFGGVATDPPSHSKGIPYVKWVKRILLAAVVVFAVFYVITRPTDAANIVQGAFGAVFTATEAIGQFFSSLAS